MGIQRRNCYACSIFVLLIASGLEAATTGWAQYNLNVTDPTTGQPTTTYALRYIPAGLDQTKPAPVVIFFHGLGGNPDSYEFTLQPAADAANCVVIAPSSIDFGWALPGDDQTVNQSLNLLQNELPIDNLRISVAGHSAGGAFAYLFCYDSIPSFSAVFTLSAPYYQVTGIADSKYKAPIRMYEGTLDPNYTGGSFAALQAQWTALGVTQESDVQSGYGHNGWPQSSMNNGFIFLVGKIYPATNYTLIVNNGTGSGSYAAGATVTITANNPAPGMVFDQWMGATVAAPALSTTTLTMPAANASVTATYKTAAVEHSPGITSAASATPNPATAGATVSFTVGASDVDGDPLSYSWTFGDGASATANATHAYAAAGSYQATVTVSDGRGGSVSSSVSVTVTASGGSSGNSGIGTGAIGTGNGTAQSAFLMTVSKIQGSAKFSGGHDACSITGVIPGLPKSFAPAGQNLTLNLGGATVSFKLDSKGRGKTAQGTIALKLKFKRDAKTKTSSFVGGDVAFSAKLKNGTWSATWGFDPNSAARNQPRDFATTLQLGAVTYAVDITVSVSTKPGVGAHFAKK